MSHNAHEQLPSPQSTGKPSGATRDARKWWATATAAALLTLGLAPVAQAVEGGLDPTFGVSSDTGLGCDAAGGVMTCDVAGDIDQLRGMAILLPDGRIVVGGRADGAPDGDGDFVVARFHNNGSLDTTFGVGGPDGLNGLETTNVSGSNQPDEGTDLVLQGDDGKIVLVGGSGPEGLRRFAVARYTADGKLDTRFATDGIATAPFPGGGESRASAVAVQPTDQKIVVAVFQLRSPGGPPTGDFVLARFTAEGQLDSSFGGDGFVETSFPDSEREVASAVLVQPDGKIVAGGRAGPDADASAGVDFAFVRYNGDGSLDDGSPADTTPGDAFGTGGRVRTDFGQQRAEGVVALVRQPDGKIVAGGNSRSGETPTVALARYDVNGNLDQSFGTGGTETTPFPGQPGSMNALILQPGGKLVAAGRTGRTSASAPGAFALVRYQPNGREDTTFGEDVVDDLGGPPEGVPDGFILTPFGPSQTSTSTWQAVALQPDGNIVAVGFHRPVSEDNSGTDFALARYQSSVVPVNLTCQDQPPTVIGTPGVDILVGTEGNDVIHGLGGNDTIIAQGGDDIICGGPGDDLVFGGSGGDAIEGGDGIDQLVGDDEFAGTRGPDTLRGGEGDDGLYGLGGNDLLQGDAGNDELVGGPGDDVLNGGPGGDRVFGEAGADTLAGDADNDTLVGDDPFAGTGGSDVLLGGEGDDRLFGAGGNDQLFGDGGTDELVGGPGDDVVSGGPGVDGVFGEGGADALAGDAGNDTLVGDTLPSDAAAGPDVLRGGEGNDKLFGAAGNDQLLGDAGRDELDGGPGNDNLDGGPGNDRKLFGGSGNDTMRGGPGRFKDMLVGDAGRDMLRGGRGDDVLFGGPGRDRLLGEAGNDQLDGQGGPDSGLGGPGRPDRCFSMGPRGACENLNVGSPPKQPRAIPRPPPPLTPDSSPVPPVCNVPQCGA